MVGGARVGDPSRAPGAVGSQNSTLVEFRGGAQAPFGNYAHLLLQIGRHEEGLAVAGRAHSLLTALDPKPLRAEIAYYLFAYGDDPERTTAQHTLATLIADAVATGTWPLHVHAEARRKDGDARAALLATVAEVLAGTRPAPDLKAFPDWDCPAPAPPP